VTEEPPSTLSSSSKLNGNENIFGLFQNLLHGFPDDFHNFAVKTVG
jgi:hypothetical protein